MPNKKTNNYLLAIVILLLSGSLIDINFFGPATLSAYFVYTLFGLILTLIVEISLITNKQIIKISNPLPIICMGLLAFYSLFNGVINNQGGINLRHYILVVDVFLLISYCSLLSNKTINLLSVSKIVTVTAAVESIVCLLQQFSVIPSLDSLFKVTGSSVNPNVTAMFLAMAVPALSAVLFCGSKLYRIISILSIILCTIALALLKCRTAFIGATVSVILVINYQYQLFYKLKNKFSKALLLVIVVSTLTLIAFTFLFLYHQKKSSSDGRLFIWKISLLAIAEKPVLGSGYGQFEHDYNLAQAKYFYKKTASKQEIMNAGYVHMSYNEFLENLFEGGIIGLGLFLLLLVILLLPTNFTLEGSFSYAGIATFTIMSFFNFTVQALPVRALFIFYTAVCCVYSTVSSTLIERLLSLCRLYYFNRTSFRVVATAFSIFLFLKLLTLSKAYNRCHTQVENQTDLSFREAVQQLEIYKTNLSQSTYYLRNYAELLARNRYYDAAIEKFNKALEYSSDPNLYMQLGNCYSKKGQLANAMDAYEIAANIEPHRFAPKYGLMRLYKFANDTTKAKLIAQEIVSMNPKVESEKVVFYKKEAKAVLNFYF